MKVRIGPYDFDIVEMDKLNTKEFYGLYVPESQEIQLTPVFASKQRWAETLLHEILHGVMDTQNIGLKDEEERVVRGVSLGLSQVIRDNQKLFTEIVRALK